MRKLIFKRKWSIIESGSRITLSVECDEAKCNAKFDDKFFMVMPIKNGETKEIEISENQTLICLQSSTMDAEFVVPAGTSDVTLQAKPKFNPMQGNPFTITEIK